MSPCPTSGAISISTPDISAASCPAFTTSGLVVREQSNGDGRRQVVRLTPNGRRAFAELDRLQADAIDTLLAPLDHGNNVNSSPRWGGFVACSAAEPSSRPRGRAFSCGHPSRATSVGLSSGTAPAMPPNTAGTRHSRPWWRASSPTSPNAATPGARRPGSPRWTANASAACSALPPTRPRPRSCACCSLSRPRAASVSAPGSSTSACASPGRLYANHVVDQRCTTAARQSTSARFRDRASPPQLRARPRRRVLVSRPVTGHAAAPPRTRWMSGFIACSWPPQ